MILINNTYYVELRAKSHEIGDGIDHLVAHALSCTLESEDESVMGYGSICFGSLNEVMNDDELVWLGEDKAQVKKCLSIATDGSKFIGC